MLTVTANKLPLTGELTLPGKIILEAEVSDVIFLIADGGRPDATKRVLIDRASTTRSQKYTQ